MSKVNTKSPGFIAYFLIAIAILFLTTTNITYAGDAKFKNVISPMQMIYLNQAIFIALVLQNLESYPVTELLVSARIKDKDENEVFAWDSTLASLEPNSEMTLSSEPYSWFPELPGQYKLYLELESDVDINPTNNTLEYDFTVQEPPEPVLEYEIEQLNFKDGWEHPNSLAGLMTFTYGPLEEVKYVNVMGVNPETQDTAWIVKNLTLLPFEVEQKLSYCFDFSLLNFSDGEDISEMDIGLMLSDTNIIESFIPDFWYSSVINDLDYTIGFDNPVELEPEFTFEYSEPVFDLGPQIIWEYRGCNVPNIELDYSKSPASATYAGDLNACGPAAAANSMQWLMENHPNIDDNTQSHRDKMVELSKMMNRLNNEGVTTQQIVKAKLDFVDKYKLPISVKYQSHFVTNDTIQSPNTAYGHTAKNKSDSARKPPTWDWLLSEFQNGEDIEMLFGWYDSAATRHGGHWVTVTGLSDVGTAKGLYFKDDLHQDADSGTREMFVNWVEGTGGWSRLAGFRGPNSYCWVESVVSESYDSTVTFEANEIDDSGETKFNINVWENPSRVAHAINISFALSETYDLKIMIYDLAGNKIATISEGNYSPGEYKVQWNGLDSYGKQTAAGTYLIVFSANGKEYTTKIIRE